jgi:uncharacterized membrane protein YuzA (DUF378 family)
MKKLNGIDMIALVLVIIGAINWGLVGLFNYNLVGSIFGHLSGFTRFIYTLVGLSGIYLAFASARFARVAGMEDQTKMHGGHAAT